MQFYHFLYSSEKIFILALGILGHFYGVALNSVLHGTAVALRKRLSPEGFHFHEGKASAGSPGQAWVNRPHSQSQTPNLLQMKIEKGASYSLSSDHVIVCVCLLKFCILSVFIFAFYFYFIFYYRLRLLAPHRVDWTLWCVPTKCWPFVFHVPALPWVHLSFWSSLLSRRAMFLCLCLRACSLREKEREDAKQVIKITFCHIRVFLSPGSLCSEVVRMAVCWRRNSCCMRADLQDLQD